MDRRQNTTHDWAAGIDRGHLRSIRDSPATYAPGGLLHLVLEVVAHPVDEAVSGTTTCVEVVLHEDGPVSVSDDGRGTDTRVDEAGRPLVKPVMATRDLRFFGAADAPLLPDGHPRRGMSVVAALSTRLTHTNRRAGGAWTRHYEHGLPVDDPEPLADDGSTGTTVRFLADPALVDATLPDGPVVRALCSRIAATQGVDLTVVLQDRRAR